MNHRLFNLLALALTAMASCGSPSTSNPSLDTALVPQTTVKEMVDECDGMQGNTLQETLYYAGSDSAYDYYIFSPSLRPLGPDLNKVSRKKNDQPNRMPFAMDRSRWVFVAGLPPAKD